MQVLPLPIECHRKRLVALWHEVRSLPTDARKAEWQRLADQQRRGKTLHTWLRQIGPIDL